MSIALVLAILVILSAIGFSMGRSRAIGTAGGDSRTLHSLPSYYGFYVALWCGVPGFVLLIPWSAFETSIITSLVLAQVPDRLLTDADGVPLDSSALNLLVTDIRNIAGGQFGSTNDQAIQQAAESYSSYRQVGTYLMVAVISALSAGGLAFAHRQIDPRMRARNTVESTVRVFMLLCSTVAVLTTLGIVLSLIFEAYRFFAQIPLLDFLFGLQWSPQIALRADQAGSSGAFGAVPLFTGTLLISAIAMLVAVPIGLLSAIYMAEYAPRRVRAVVKPLLEILAGIPTVVYGFFAALTVAPFIRNTGESIGLAVSSESALAAGGVMGIMIIPFVSSLSDDVINAVPQSMRDGAYGLGATKAETVKNVILPAALPGIVGSILLAVSRAIGETMIVAMAAGLAANLTANPLEAVTTVTVQIVTLLVGDQEFDSPKTLAAFALGLVLFLVTLCLNVIALYVVRKYREQYE